jgi:hypothetical protein
MARKSMGCPRDSPAETLLKDARGFYGNKLPPDQEILRCDFPTTPCWRRRHRRSANGQAGSRWRTGNRPTKVPAIAHFSLDRSEGDENEIALQLRCPRHPRLGGR